MTNPDYHWLALLPGVILCGFLLIREVVLICRGSAREPSVPADLDFEADHDSFWDEMFLERKEDDPEKQWHSLTYKGRILLVDSDEDPLWELAHELATGRTDFTFDSELPPLEGSSEDDVRMEMIAEARRGGYDVIPCTVTPMYACC
jgi:hypothetical protein